MDSAYSPRRRHPILRICTVIFLLLLLAGGIWAYHAGLFTGLSSTLEFEDLDSLPWNLILVNQDHAIPEGWSQELTTLSNGTQVDSRIYPELQQMFDDMRAQGVYPVVASGYRSAEKQQSLMDDKIKEFIDQGESAAQAKKDVDQYVTPGSVIILNYGVNDLSRHNDYITTINRYAQDWISKGATVYFASVGPVGENEYGKRNWAVEYFNNQLNNRLDARIGRLNLYVFLTGSGYTTQADGLHYDGATYAAMFRFLMQSIGRI